jgi:hypothetical protein
MARIRTIKPEFWTDSFMVKLPPIGRLIYIALWTVADDHGLIPDEPERLAMEVMPRENALDFDDWLQFFEASGRIEHCFSADGQSWYEIVRWNKHQRVDKPSKSRFPRESSRKLAIPQEVRQKVAQKYGCAPGAQIDAACYYCGTAGRIHWHKHFDGRPSGWVSFPGLELDHLIAESTGGKTVCENIVLACRRCNRSKGTAHWFDVLCAKQAPVIPDLFANTREGSGEEQGTGKGSGKGTGNREKDSPSPVVAVVIAAYHDTLPRCQRCEVLTPQREKRIATADKLARSACRQLGWDYDPDTFWRAYFAECADDAWLRGDVPNPKNARWKQNLAVLIDDERFGQIMDRAIAAMRADA